MTKRLYYTNNAVAGEATVTRLDEATRQVFLDRTLFAPQGGGQPCDLGTIGETAVLRVDYSDTDDIVHTLTSVTSMAVGDVVTIRIDAKRRNLNSRYHTAGHLVAGVAERLLPQLKAKGGHHWPGEARVDFICDYEPSVARFTSALNAELIDAIETNARVTATNGDPSPRLVTIDSFAALSCGGTHVSRLSELGRVVVRNVKLKKSVLRVGYEIEPTDHESRY